MDTFLTIDEKGDKQNTSGKKTDGYRMTTLKQTLKVGSCLLESPGLEMAETIS